MDRRQLLRGFLSTIGMVPLASPLWAAAGGVEGRAIVLVFLRGGCDGLNVVVPYADDNYYAARPQIAVAPPSSSAVGAALDIDGFFGLHPSLDALRQIFWEGRLGLIPAVHHGEITHSHFRAQAVVERAGGGAGHGWLNRYLEVSGTSKQGLSISDQVPESLQGARVIPAYADPMNRVLSNAPAVDSILGRVLAEAYIEPRNTSAVLESWRSAAIELESTRFRSFGTPASHINYPDVPLGSNLAATAALLREEHELSVVAISDGGWDTHSHQGGATGRQATQLANLAAALAAFDADLGSRRDDVAVLVQTEFGRTLRENASGGTDHGGASTWMVISSTMRGGIHLGTRGWPGLDEGSLLDGRALAPAVDFRDVYADLLRAHLGCPDVDAVLPDRPGLVTGLV